MILRPLFQWRPKGSGGAYDKRKDFNYEPTKHPDPSSRRAASGLSGLLRQPGYPDTQHRRSGSRRRNLSEPLYGLSGLYPIPLFAI